MEIKFTGTEINHGKKRNGEVWKATRVVGDKLSDGSEWRSGNIFHQDDSQELLESIAQLEVGDKVDVKHKKVDGNWKIVGVVPVSGNSGGSRASYKGKPQGSKPQGGKSDQMSKEEWAEKDRVNALRIAKSVALKAAVDNTPVGTDPDTVLEMADQWVSWLHNPDLTYESMVSNSGDPLDPPV